MHPRQLIITADDCGLSEGINTTALHLHQSRLLTTATVMMNFPATEHALLMLADTPTLHGGVHLNLTDGYPLTDIDPSCGLIIADGRFQSRAALFARAMFPTDGWLLAVEREMHAQIDAYRRRVGRSPEHLTTHMHFHIIPSLREVVFRLARQFRVEWVRAFQTSSTLIPYNFLVQRPSELFHPDNLKITPDYIASVQAWMALDPAQLVQAMIGLDGLIELVVHPDTPDDDSYPADMNHPPAARDKERDFLVRFGAALDAHEGTLVIADPGR
jgi:predicted glycoside hydrolase/deacetylase ChbG (UPF0249 family)